MLHPQRWRHRRWLSLWLYRYCQFTHSVGIVSQVSVFSVSLSIFLVIFLCKNLAPVTATYYNFWIYLRLTCKLAAAKCGHKWNYLPTPLLFLSETEFGCLGWGGERNNLCCSCRAPGRLIFGNQDWMQPTDETLYIIQNTIHINFKPNRKGGYS